MTPAAAAYRRLRTALERLRGLAQEAAAAIAEADKAGVGAEALLSTLRLEYQDWARALPDMQLVAEMLSATGSRTRIDALIMVDQPVATPHEQARYEEDQGFLAYHVGRASRDNPYSRGTREHRSWLKGWMSAKQKDL